MLNNSDTFGNRFFYLAFALAFFIFSILFLFLVTTVHPNMPGVAAVEPRDGENFGDWYIPRREDAITVLFIGQRPGGVTADTFILAKFDPTGGRVPIAVLPPQTMLQNGERVEPISRIYEFGGSEQTKNVLATTLDIPIDRYVTMNTDIFIAVANVIGTVEFDLPFDLTARHNGVNITLSAGKQLLDGKLAADIIRGADYPGGELERSKMIAALTAAIVNQRIDVVESTLIDAIFERIINLIDSDISYNDYDSRKSAAQFLARLATDPALPVQVAGTFSDDGSEFTLSDTFMAIVTYSF